MYPVGNRTPSRLSRSRGADLFFKQRVLLARALYRRPRILILDQGTSHLDVETEKAVNAALSQLAITRLVVAHRPETLRAAGRVVSLEGGVAREGSAVLNHQQKRNHENVDFS
jgi:ABC-type bacteriocin/lantibiotic exporter with double-glycine peptidase domain